MKNTGWASSTESSMHSSGRNSRKKTVEATRSSLNPLRELENAKYPLKPPTLSTKVSLPRLQGLNLPASLIYSLSLSLSKASLYSQQLYNRICDRQCLFPSYLPLERDLYSLYEGVCLQTELLDFPIVAVGNEDQGVHNERRLGASDLSICGRQTELLFRLYAQPSHLLLLCQHK